MRKNVKPHAHDSLPSLSFTIGEKTKKEASPSIDPTFTIKDDNAMLDDVNFTVTLTNPSNSLRNDPKISVSSKSNESLEKEFASLPSFSIQNETKRKRDIDPKESPRDKKRLRKDSKS
jgi:hypothetical protein